MSSSMSRYVSDRHVHSSSPFEFNKEQSAQSRKDIDEYLKKTHAQMWIEHDQATYDKLKKAPAFYE